MQRALKHYLTASFWSRDNRLPRHRPVLVTAAAG